MNIHICTRCANLNEKETAKTALTEEHFDWRTPQMVEYLGLHECIDLNAIETIEKRDLSMISN